MSLTVAQAKRDFQRGYLKAYYIGRNLHNAEWHVLLAERENAQHQPLVDARKGYTRSFRTLDAAVAAVEDIGFEVNLLR